MLCRYTILNKAYTEFINNTNFMDQRFNCLMLNTRQTKQHIIESRVLHCLIFDFIS